MGRRGDRGRQRLERRHGRGRARLRRRLPRWHRRARRRRDRRLSRRRLQRSRRGDGPLGRPDRRRRGRAGDRLARPGAQRAGRAHGTAAYRQPCRLRADARLLGRALHRPRAVPRHPLRRARPPRYARPRLRLDRRDADRGGAPRPARPRGADQLPPPRRRLEDLRHTERYAARRSQDRLCDPARRARAAARKCPRPAPVRPGRDAATSACRCNPLSRTRHRRRGAARS